MAQAKKAAVKKATKASAPPAVKKAAPKVAAKSKATAPVKPTAKPVPIKKTTASVKAAPAKVTVAKTVPAKAVPSKAAPAKKPAAKKPVATKVTAKKAAPASVPLPTPVFAAVVAPRMAPPKPAPAVSDRDVKAAVDYLLQRSASRSESSVMVNGKRLLSEEELLRMPESDYMNEAQLDFFRHRLREVERELVANAGETTEHLRETVIVPDPADRATIEEEHALELRTRDRERKLLKKVQASLNRIESGDYGWCEETGEPIGIPRLLARPTATLSLEAQQRRELKQKLYGD
ncbi:MAG: RNA polymerase-binding protein DksA [Burkholderiaceae bacterium]